jgi:hypothetical protein
MFWRIVGSGLMAAAAAVATVATGGLASVAVYSAFYTGLGMLKTDEFAWSVGYSTSLHDHMSAAPSTSRRDATDSSFTTSHSPQSSPPSAGSASSETKSQSSIDLASETDPAILRNASLPSETMSRCSAKVFDSDLLARCDSMDTSDRQQNKRCVMGLLVSELEGAFPFTNDRMLDVASAIMGNFQQENSAFAFDKSGMNRAYGIAQMEAPMRSAYDAFRGTEPDSARMQVSPNKLKCLIMQTLIFPTYACS